jgi:hypothetical protein
VSNATWVEGDHTVGPDVFTKFIQHILKRCSFFFANWCVPNELMKLGWREVATWAAWSFKARNGVVRREL